MFTETIRDAFAFIGYLGFIVALLGIGLNEILYGTWYGETEEQRRERVRKERREAGSMAHRCAPLQKKAGGRYAHWLRNDRTGEN